MLFFPWQLIDIHKNYYKDVCKRAAACLEPTQKVVSRIRPTAAAAGSHSAPVREGYPHAELLLGDCFLKYGEQFGRDTTFGRFGNLLVGSLNIVLFVLITYLWLIVLFLFRCCSAYGQRKVLATSRG